MDTRTGAIYERDEANEKWLVDQMAKARRDHPESLPEEMTDEEMQEHIKSGRMITGTKEELLRRRKMMELSAGTKNKKKKARQMQKASRKKNRKK